MLSPTHALRRALVAPHPTWCPRHNWTFTVKLAHELESEAHDSVGGDISLDASRGPAILRSRQTASSSRPRGWSILHDSEHDISVSSVLEESLLGANDSRLTGGATETRPRGWSVLMDSPPLERRRYV